MELQLCEQGLEGENRTEVVEFEHNLYYSLAGGFMSMGQKTLATPHYFLHFIPKVEKEGYYIQIERRK